MDFAFLVNLAVLVVLFFINGFFTMAETAIVSARSARLQLMREHGRWGTERAIALVEDPNEFLSLVQIGITLVGVISGAFGGATLSKPLAQWLAQFGIEGALAWDVSMVLVVGGITYFSIVAGELIPKRIALRFAEEIACLLAPFLHLLSLLLKPFIKILDWSGDLLLKPFGLDRVMPRPVTAEEVQHLARQGHLEGEIDQSELGMVERVFTLSDRPVRSVMTPRNAIEWLEVGAASEEVKTVVLLSRFSRFPVARQSLDNPVGVVNARDLLCQLAAGGPIDLSRMMKPALFLPETVSVMAALQRLRGADCAMAIIIDQYGGCLGLVTLEDLEGILVDAPLAPGQPGSEVNPGVDGSLVMDGMLDVERFREILKLKSLPEEDSVSYSTLGGLAMAALGRVPEVGDRFDWEGFQLEILSMDGLRVDKALVRHCDGSPLNPTA